MKHNLLVLGSVALLGVAAVMTGIGDAGQAVACDDAVKTAATKTSCCAKDAKTASAQAKGVHSAMVKSAVVAPGASPILNIAAFGGMLASSSQDGDCGWCPPEMCEAMAAAAGCPAYSAKSATHNCMARGASATTASVKVGSGCSTKSAQAAMASGCRTSSGATASAASSGCDHAAAAKTASASCCEAKTASARAACEKKLETASLEDVVDEIPYRKDKRLVLTGNYECGNCTLHATEACAPMFKTSDGKVYPLVKNFKASDLRKAHAENGVEVSTVVRQIDGVKYLDVKGYKIL